GNPGSGGSDVGEPRGNRALALETGFGSDMEPAPGTARKVETELRAAAAARRIQTRRAEAGNCARNLIAGAPKMNLIQTIEQEEIARLGKIVTAFAPGDTVVVSVNVVEGDRKRVQAYEGVVIAKRNRGLNSSFIVRKVSSGEGVERTFQTYSPLIASIEVKRRGDVRRAKLYYLRQRSGKSARIREKLHSAEKNGGQESPPAGE